MKRLAAPIITAMLLLLPVLYVGSYGMLVTPGGVMRVDPATGGHVWYLDCQYRAGGEWSERVYWPLEQIDRRIRPVTWDPKVQEQARIKKLFESLYEQHPGLRD